MSVVFVNLAIFLSAFSGRVVSLTPRDTPKSIVVLAWLERGVHEARRCRCVIASDIEAIDHRARAFLYFGAGAGADCRGAARSLFATSHDARADADNILAKSSDKFYHRHGSFDLAYFALFGKHLILSL